VGIEGERWVDEEVSIQNARLTGGEEWGGVGRNGDEEWEK